MTPVPGTTRDYLRERITLGNSLVQLLDTAGVRESAEEIEIEGIRRTRAVIDRADLVLFVLDGSEDPDEEDEKLWRETEGKVRFVIFNKCDLTTFKQLPWHGQSGLQRFGSIERRNRQVI